MSERLLTAVLLLQTLLLTALLAERLMPTAHATQPMTCQVTNWPDAITGNGYDAIRVRLADTTPLPVTVKDWETSDHVRVQLERWNTRDEVRVGVVNWDTSDRVTITQ